MLASGSWYTSATTLAWIAIAVAAIVGIVGILPWFLNIPKRLLIYITESTSLLLASELTSSDAEHIEVAIRGQVVDDPHLVTLTIDSRSRRDIRAGDFDEGKPLLFHLGAPIVAMRFALENQGSHELESNARAISAVGTPIQTVQIKPILIRRGRWCRLELLTAGSPDVTCESPIADVKVRRAAPAVPKPIYWAIGGQILCLLFVGGVAANPHPGLLEAVVAMILMTAAIAIDGWIVAAWRRRP